MHAAISVHWPANTEDVFIYFSLGCGFAAKFCPQLCQSKSIVACYFLCTKAVLAGVRLKCKNKMRGREAGGKKDSLIQGWRRTFKAFTPPALKRRQIKTGEELGSCFFAVCVVILEQKEVSCFLLDD